MGEGSSEVPGWSELRRGVLGSLRPFVQQRDQVEDIAQETLMRAWVGWSRGNIRKLGMGWVHRVSRRIAIDRRRERLRRPSHQCLTRLDYGARDPRRLPRQLRTCYGTFPLMVLLSSLDEAIQSLPQELRLVFCARARGVSYREIACRLRIGLSTVRMRLARGKRILEQEILRDLKKRGEL